MCFLRDRVFVLTTTCGVKSVRESEVDVFSQGGVEKK